METKKLKTVPKTSVRIWRPIIEKLDAKIEAACLRRDAFLSKVLEVELDWLDQEVSIPNSQASYEYVAEQLDGLDRKLMSLALPPVLTSRLNEICSRKRIVRDAFFNRLFLLLVASPDDLDKLLFGNVANEWRQRVWREFKQDGQVFENSFYPLEPTIDPFWAIRTGLDLYNDDGGHVDYVEPTSGQTVRVKRDLVGAIAPPDAVYTTIFQQKARGSSLLGLSCYMPDWLIPGQPAESERLAKQKAVFDNFVDW
jgi:hypothetical protein